MSPNNAFCSNLLEYNQVWIVYHYIGSVMFALGLIYFFMSLVIIYFIKLQEYIARSGNDVAVRSVIFPVFVNVLWVNALVNIYVGVVACIFTFESFNTRDNGALYSFALMYAAQHYGKLLILIYCSSIVKVINRLHKGI
jgi:hypothetical protein